MPSSWEIMRRQVYATNGPPGAGSVYHFPPIVDPAKVKALIDAERAATGAIEAEIMHLEGQRAAAESPGVKAALTKGINALRDRREAW